MNRGKNVLGLAGFVAWILAMLLFGKTTSVGQNCTGDVCRDCPDNSTGKINIMDLGTGFYGGLQGGLYPNGENSRPITHNDAGLAFTDAVVPLDMNGEEDFVNGKIVLLSIGFSNAQEEYCYFKDKADALPQRNPYLVVVNGAIAGWPIEKIIDPTINQVYWEGDDNAIPPIKGVEDFLEDADANWGQVQAIWFKTANLGPTETDFRDYILTLRNQYIDGMAILQEKFPNNHLCYLSDRTFGGYSLDLGNPEPYAYWTGWAVKRLIQRQLDGNLPYGEDSPWLSWGPYLWADGVIERSDGVKWQCDDFRVNDRRHPSDCGRTRSRIC